MSNQIQTPQSQSKPVEILGWVAAGSTAVVGALALIDGVPSWVVAVVAAIGLVATKLLAYATTKQTVPLETVVAQRNDETGDIVAGPAATVETGRVVDQPVEAGPSPYSPPR